jgi:short-subunit dehydrogenase
MDLAGAVCVVTGASAGIGRATALAVARKGADLVLAARREQLLHEVAGEIERLGRRALVVPCDVTSLAQIEALRDRTREAFGRCDVLVNDAGIPGGGPFADLTVDQIDRVVRTNYLGLLFTTKAFLPMMLEAGRGHVVNVASLAGRFAVPGSSVYSSTKHAVVAFSEALSYEVRPRGVLVTAVNPGLVATEGFPQTKALQRGIRVMRPERVADLIVKVVEKEISPERSIPRTWAAMQVLRILAPGLYRRGLRRVVARRARPTPAGPVQPQA